MTLISDLTQLKGPLKNPVLTIGNFDGMHKGHLALFDKVKERARFIAGQSAVMTFEPHPIRVIAPGNGPPLLTPIKQKLRLIEETGIDIIFCIPFTKKFAGISARGFVKDILVDTIGIKELVVGYDYTFGLGREGNIDLLKEMGNLLGFSVHVMEPVRINGTLVSSTLIRNLVQEGNLKETKRLLGRDYQISGTVVKGKNRGDRLLGFSTANLEPIDELTPRVGVYAVKVHIEGDVFYGLTNIGYNPTFGDETLTIETHILDLRRDLVGKTIRVDFIERLRDEKTFESIDELAEQIGKDVVRARELFKTLP